MSQLVIKKLVLGIISTNCYVLYNDEMKEAIVIDPADQADRIIEKLTEYQLKPAAVLLTHGHFDHIGAAEELRDRYGIKIYVYHEEQDLLKETAQNMATMIHKNLSMEADVLLRDGQMLEIGGISIRVIHTPGHTQGSCCYYIKESNVLFSGDTLFYESHGRTDFPTGSESAIIRSITGKLLTLEPSTVVYPGHDDATSIEHERQFYHDYY